MKRFQLACMQYLRLLLPMTGCSALALEFSPIFNPKSILNISIAVIFLSLANYSMSWAINSEVLESAKQKVATRQASRELLIGALFMGLASIDLIQTIEKSATTMIQLISILQATAYTLGLFWGLLGTDRLIRSTIAEHRQLQFLGQPDRNGSLR